MNKLATLAALAAFVGSQVEAQVDARDAKTIVIDRRMLEEICGSLTFAGITLRNIDSDLGAPQSELDEDAQLFARMNDHFQPPSADNAFFSTMTFDEMSAERREYAARVGLNRASSASAAASAETTVSKKCDAILNAAK